MLTQAAKSQDEIEDYSFGPDCHGDELPKKIHHREARRETSRRSIKTLEKHKAKEAKAKADAAAAQPAGDQPAAPVKTKPGSKAKTHFPAPARRIMRMPSEAFDQICNTQVAVNEARQFVVAAAVTKCAKENDHLLPVLSVAFDNTKLIPKVVLADDSNKNESNFAELQAMRIDTQVARCAKARMRLR